MAVGDWSAATLCVHGDVTSRYSRAGDLTGETIEADQQTEITAVIAKAKIYIGKMLDRDLKIHYGDREYDIADLKDLISNEEVLKEACVAYTLKLLFEENTVDPEDYNYRKMESFEKEFQTFYDSGVHLIEFDIDESGEIEDEEKAWAIGRYRFHRV